MYRSAPQRDWKRSARSARGRIIVQRTDSDLTQMANIPDDCAMPFGVFRRVGRHACRINDTTGSAMISYLIELSSRETSVHEDGPRIHARRGEKNCNECPAVFFTIMTRSPGRTPESTSQA